MLFRYGLPGADRAFDVELSAPLWGLKGRIDLLLSLGLEVWPVEHKPRASEPRKGDLLQLCAYGLALEEMTGSSVRSGFWVGSCSTPQQVDFSCGARGAP